MSLSKSAKIYKLINENALFYIGSTKQDLNKRLLGHMYSKNNYLSSKKLFENNKKVKIELIEEFTYNCKKDILIKEKHYIQQNINNKQCMNKYIPYITDLTYSHNKNKYACEYSKSWYENNKDKKKLYYEINKEKIQKQQKEYRELRKIDI